MAPKKEVENTLEIKQLQRVTTKLRIIGERPLYQNRMAAKAMRELLVGNKKKSAADKAHIKHDPLREFRDSAEILSDGPTALGLNVIAVKAAMCTAALETPGVAKTSAQRLLYMPGTFVPLYGVPHLKMDVVRNADPKHTPDIRTRCYLPQWGAELEVKFVTPQLSLTSVVNLLYNAGLLVGIGDYRQEKGKGNFGQFRILLENKEDNEWNDLVAHHGRSAQEAALNNPEYADKDTADLMEFFFNEVQKRRAA